MNYPKKLTANDAILLSIKDLIDEGNLPNGWSVIVQATSIDLWLVFYRENSASMRPLAEIRVEGGYIFLVCLSASALSVLNSKSVRFPLEDPESIPNVIESAYRLVRRMEESICWRGRSCSEQQNQSSKS